MASELLDREGGEQGWDGGQRDTRVEALPTLEELFDLGEALVGGVDDYGIGPAAA
jgi:hypothetical protein